MADFPILFTIRHVVKGPNFEAVVTANGRTLITHEDGEWWCLGVEPGGMAEAGDGPTVASARFSSGFRHALEDLAELAENFEAFQNDAAALFHTDPVDAARWDEALRRIQHERIVPESISQLPRKIWTGESDLEILPLAQLESSPKEAVVQETRSLPAAA